MQIARHDSPDPPRARNPGWQNRLFSAKTAQTGGIVRRKRRDVDREIGRDALIAEVRRRGFHLLETGDQYLIVCHSGTLRLVC